MGARKQLGGEKGCLISGLYYCIVLQSPPDRDRTMDASAGLQVLSPGRHGLIHPLTPQTMASDSGSPVTCPSEVSPATFSPCPPHLAASPPIAIPGQHVSKPSQVRAMKREDSSYPSQSGTWSSCSGELVLEMGKRRRCTTV